MEDKKEEKPDLIQELRSYRLTYHFEDAEGTGLSLLDRLSPDDDSDVGRGLEEIQFIAEHIEDLFITPLQSQLSSLQQENESWKKEHFESIEDASKTIKKLEEENKRLSECTKFLNEKEITSAAVDSTLNQHKTDKWAIDMMQLYFNKGASWAKKEIESFLKEK